jgi:hypothetical protein
MPLYSAQVQPGNQNIAPYPVYQGFFAPCFVNGIQVQFNTQRETYWNLWPNYIQPLANVATGDGTTQTFQFNLPFYPAIPGHVDMSGIIASGSLTDPIFTNELITTIPTTSVYAGVYLTYTSVNGSNVVITDSGQFLSGNTNGSLYGLLLETGPAPFGNSSLGSYDLTTNTVNYETGVVNVTFPEPPLANSPIQAQCYFYQQGIPRSILFYNNTITVRPPPNTQYLVELGAYLTPAAFLSSENAISYSYMSEYLARGAARKILADTGDIDQFMFYEPLFKEQENLVWKRSQRQFTATRTPTIYSQGIGGQGGLNNFGTTNN